MVDPSSADNFAVSVVIPTYNRIKQLPIALNSVLSQTRSVTEILVVDDGSTDKTVENLSPKYNSHIFKAEKRGCFLLTQCRYKSSKSPWIALLDSDDQWMPDKIEKQIHYLSENNEIKACHTGENGFVTERKSRHAFK